MTLTKEQIDQLFAFTRKKYVRYYDVQVELVDHLATAVEEKISNEPSITFEKALQDVYKSFGIFGFSKVVEQKERQLEKYWRKRIMGYLKTYFKLPKILITLLLTAIIFQSFCLIRSMSSKEWYSENHIQLLLPVLILISMVLVIFLVRKFRKGSNELRTQLLTVRAFETSTMLSFSFFIQVLIQAMVNINVLNTSPIILGFLSFLLAILVIIFRATLIVFPHWIKEDVESKYPEYIIV